MAPLILLLSMLSVWLQWCSHLVIQRPMYPTSYFELAAAGIAGLSVHLSRLQVVLDRLKACLAHLPAEAGHVRVTAALFQQARELQASVGQQQASTSAGR